MNEKTAKDTIKGIQPRTWNTNGQPNKPLPKTWNGSGRVVRDTEKGGKNEK